jgi:DNA-binding LytR/AlgR family response regulator
MYKMPFFFRQDGLLKKIDLDDIIYLEAAKNYTKIYTNDGMYIARVTLVEAMELLPENKFLRVHRSFAVATDHIDVVARDVVRLTTIRVEVPVSRMYYVELTKKVIILDSAAIDTGRKRTVKGRTKRIFR